ncbi:MAG: FHA domain-containing protein [Betaproteobacteria bacterium]|nr:FHA domain-containing protein [Betaproteobacteria bacterium]
MPFALQVMEGQLPGEILPILSNEITLGRSSGQLLLEDTEVSGKHCTIQMLAGELFVVDHGSRNGTLVNGQKVDRLKLRTGDRLKVGGNEFRIVDWPMASDFLDPMKMLENWCSSLAQGERDGFSQNIAELIRKEWQQCLEDVHLKLTLEARDGRVVNYSVPVKEIVVGRSGVVPLLAEDEEASRKHARFYVREDGRVCVEDLMSANGTFVNEERLAGSRPLSSTDIIRLGKTRMQVSTVLPEFIDPI